ncbi:hypothetical protein [Haloquadratum walsbyi]|nr:hypothetical protein [Haloquadratum walsbyi]
MESECDHDLDTHRSRWRYPADKRVDGCWAASIDYTQITLWTAIARLSYRQQYSHLMYLTALRKFLQYCERGGTLDYGFDSLTVLPTISKHEGQDERCLDRETAKEIIEHLEIYRPFTKAHVVWAILSETVIRSSIFHAFDFDDYDADERYLAAASREEPGTRLKNGSDWEREISISGDTAQTIDRYIEANRDIVTDDHC